MQLTYNIFFLVAYFCFLYYGQTDTPYKMCISRSRKLHLSLPVFISTYKSTYLCVCLSIRKVTFISSYSHMQISYKYTFLCLCLSNENVAFMSSCIPMQLTYNLFFLVCLFQFSTIQANKYTFLCLCLSIEKAAFISCCNLIKLTYT